MAASTCRAKSAGNLIWRRPGRAVSHVTNCQSFWYQRYLPLFTKVPLTSIFVPSRCFHWFQGASQTWWDSRVQPELEFPADIAVPTPISCRIRTLSEILLGLRRLRRTALSPLTRRRRFRENTFSSDRRLSLLQADLREWSFDGLTTISHSRLHTRHTHRR